MTARPPLPYRVLGDGPVLLLIHGAAEDADMLSPQAQALADAGWRVIWYDRRGTGDTPRDGWPERGVDGHSSDAADILRDHGGSPATVLGFSSGGVIALELAAQHPDLIKEVIAWEPAALGAIPDGIALHEQIMAPIEDQLQRAPGEWVDAFTLMLEIISDGAADLRSPEAQAQMKNAEPAVRDDARIITRHQFAPRSLPVDTVTLTMGGDSSPLHAGVIDELERAHGLTRWVIDTADDHEVYLSRPEILADALRGRQ